MKDWIGNEQSTMQTMGARNFATTERHIIDYYATEPKALELLLELETFSDVWECACGEGHLSEVLKNHSIHLRSSDLIDRGYGEKFDFLSIENQDWDGDIITNPPFKYSTEFIYKALSIMQNDRKLALLLPIRYLEGKARRYLYDSNPPIKIYASSSRLICAINGKFEEQTGSAMSYAWFIWRKGYKGDTIIKWFN